VVLKPTRAGLTRAAQMIRSGGVIAFPTDTVFGLGAAADDEIATRRVFHIKGRPVGLPLILMVAPPNHSSRPSSMSTLGPRR